MNALHVLREFHRICRSRPDAVREAVAAVRDDLPRRHALFGTDPIPFSLTPRLWTRAAWRAEASRCATLAEILEKAAHIVLRTEPLLRLYRFPEEFLQILATDPGYHRIAPILRLDGHYVNNVFRILEVNADGSAGMNDTNALGEAVRGTELYAAFCRSFTLEPCEMVMRLAQMIMTFHAGAPARTGPRVAILDVLGMKTASEFEAVRERLEILGAEVEIVHPEDLDYNRGLIVRGRKIDIVYRRLVTSDAIRIWDRLTPLLKAYRRGQISMVGSFRSEILHSKAILTVMHRAEIQRRLTAVERRWVAIHFPKAYVVDQDAAKHVLSAQGKWVLKPFGGYGSVNVTIGRLVTASVWRQALSRALAEGSYVLQEFVPASREPVVRVQGNRVSIRRDYTSVGIFLYRGKTAGAYIRSGPSHPLSISYGAVTRPGFIVAPAPRLVPRSQKREY
ncbi:MAG: circularly permuted type 2 ATP-grasp protein [Deltaproteobacteria bacterium]|nr:circularly permuted type 2 ATP-grasp protein [Deltaproteobacteria bacterium]